MRADRWTRFAGLAAVLLAAAAASACADIFASPAPGPARLALALHTGAHAPQPQPGPQFDEVDGLVVRVTRGRKVVVETSYAVSFPIQGEIRRTLVVMLESDEEELGLFVELHRQGVAVYAGGRAVRLVRGRKTAAEIDLRPVDPVLRPLDSAVGCP